MTWYGIFGLSCLYLGIGVLISVVGLKGIFSSYTSRDAEDTMFRGFVALLVILTWPIFGVMLVLGRMTYDPS